MPPNHLLRHVHVQPPSTVPLTAVACPAQSAAAVHVRVQFGKPPKAAGWYPAAQAPQLLEFASTLGGQYWQRVPYHALEHVQLQFGGTPVGGTTAWLLQWASMVHTGVQAGYPP